MDMKMRTKTLLALLLLAGICQAQEELPTIVPDRPGNTWGAEVTQHRKIAWDNGFTFESAADGTQSMTLNSTNLRYGIFENVELRLGTDFVLPKGPDGWNFRDIGIAPLTFGTKIKIHEGQGLIPSVGVLAELKTPIGTKDLPSHLAPSMYLLFEHSIGERFWLSYNAGLEWDGETATPTTFLALGMGYNITESLGAFVETYNYLHPDDGNQYMTEFGLTWLASRRVQLDLEADLDFKNFGKYYAVSCGVAWLIN